MNNGNMKGESDTEMIVQDMPRNRILPEENKTEVPHFLIPSPRDCLYQVIICVLALSLTIYSGVIGIRN